MTENDCRIWKANTSIRKLGGYAGKAWFYVSESDVNKMAEEHPEEYLGLLSIWQKALMSQDFYRMEGDKLHIVCFYVLDGRITGFEFVCLMEEDSIRILSVSNGVVGDGDWKAVKKMNRIK